MKVKSDFFISAFLFCLGFVSRVFLVEKFQSHWDGPLYSIGVAHYNLINSTPAVPGYPYYIGLGKLFNVFFSNPHVSLLFVSVLFSGIGAIAIFFLGKVLFNRTVGLISAVVLLSSPTFYFFGITTYGYIILPTTISLLTLFVYKTYVLKKKSVLYPSLFFALSLGFRPQEIFFNAPVYLLSLYKQTSKAIVISFIVISIVTLSWLVPVSQTVGGISKYISLLSNAANGQAFPSISLILNGHSYDIIVLRIIRGIYLTLGIGLPILILYGTYFFINFIRNRRLLNFINSRVFILYMVWILPCFLFNILLRIEHAGYQYTYLIALIILLSAVIWYLGRKNIKVTIFLLFLVVGFNLITFFYDRDPNYVKPYSPSSFHYSEIRKNDIKMQEKYLYITKKYSPIDSIIIVGTPELFNPIAYHFNQYHVDELDALTTDDNRFKDIKREGFNYSLKQENNTARQIKVPSSYKHVILFDDESAGWKVGKSKIINLPYNTRIVVIENITGTFQFGKHSFIQ